MVLAWVIAAPRPREFDPEGWQKWRMEVHRNPPEAPVEIQWNDGRWMRVMERRSTTN